MLVCKDRVYDQEINYARAIGLHESSCEIESRNACFKGPNPNASATSRELPFIIFQHISGSSFDHLANSVYVDTFKLSGTTKLKCHTNVDQYVPKSIRTFMMMQRAGSSRVYTRTLEMHVPSKELILTNITYTIQLHDMISKAQQ